MADKEELREQFRTAFEDAAYPVTSPMELIPALPNGPATTFESGDFSMTAMELNTEFSGGINFPFQNVNELVDTMMEQLEENDHL